MSIPTDHIRKAFKDALGGIQGLTAYANMPAQPRLPCVAPMPRSWRYDDAMGEVITWQFGLWFFLPKDDINKAQLAFDSYIAPTGPNSVPARFDPMVGGDNTLGGVVHSVRVIGGDQYLADGPVEGVRMLGAMLLVEVLA